MNLYSISELEQFSGIKPHTIRIWEKRYHALTPQRSTGNTRYYDNNQLRRLLNIVSLSENGYKVSDLGKMPDKEIFRLLEKAINDTTAASPYQFYIAKMITASLNYDEVDFEKACSSCLARFGIETTYINVLYPLLIRVGLMWRNDTICVAQEHFLSNLIRKRLYAAIDSLSLPASSTNPWLLFLPENEYHDIGLLFAQYLIRLSGKKVFFLGSNVPFESLKNAVKETNAKNLFLFLVHTNSITGTQEYLNGLAKNFNTCKIHLGGSHKFISTLKLKKQINWLQSIDQLKEILTH